MQEAATRATAMLTIVSVLLASALWSPARAPAAARVIAGRGGFQLVGHSALLGRGMNAAMAIAGHYAYVGSRTDGTHPHPGVLIVDIARPQQPIVVGEIGPPREGNHGETARELRIWPQQNLLIVENFACSVLGHRCARGKAVRSTFRFFDIAGRYAAQPRLVAIYYPTREPHEFFLWLDPVRPLRAILYITTPYMFADQLIATDITRVRSGVFHELTSWSAAIDDPNAVAYLHSLSLSADGKRAYLAYLGGGFLIADTSEVALNVAHPIIRLVTPVANRAHWGDPGAHSAVKLVGRPYVLTTDEVYGVFGGLAGTQGCPWGWVRLIDIRDAQRPRVVASYKIHPYNDQTSCASVPYDRENFASFSSHNPTVTPHVAFVSWHSGGLQAIDVTDPAHPRQAAQFVPLPLATVATEDPILSAGRDKVVVWSYPIVRNGLIYVVDIRNGLYILRYTGQYAGDIAHIGFLEGNSNRGDAARYPSQ